MQIHRLHIPPNCLHCTYLLKCFTLNRICLFYKAIPDLPTSLFHQVKLYDGNGQKLVFPDTSNV